MRALLLVPLLLAACSGPTRELRVGDAAPDFTLPDTDGHDVSLKGLLQQGPVIVAFFPKAFTSGCTREMTAYGTRHGEVAERGASILGISTDDMETLRRFRESVGAPFPMLSDGGGKVAQLYTGTKVGLANRATFVVGRDGTITRITRGSDAIDPGGDIASCPLQGAGSEAPAGARPPAPPHR
jgi:peroxiredoxin Q/BCP